MKKSKLIISILLCAAFLFAVHGSCAVVKYETVRQGSVGETVQRVQIRLRELDYLHFKPTGSFKGMTVSATIAFQRQQETADGNWVAADGEAGEQTQSILFSSRARRAPIAESVKMPIGPSHKKTADIKGTIMSWDKVKPLLRAGVLYKVYDYNTGTSFKVKFISGEGHADVECATKEDTAIFLELFGGEYNYSKRAAVVQIDADTMIAASLFGFPHGADSVKGNDMTGHVCLVFDGSTSGVGKVTDVEHQKQIYTAAGM